MTSPEGPAANEKLPQPTNKAYYERLPTGTSISSRQKLMSTINVTLISLINVTNVNSETSQKLSQSITSPSFWGFS